ncbi:MAG: hypothetical protein F6K48_26290 [Okeania sp. SIO3H1]|uniref:hypothetical protein n=1 Tax=Okeania sp. SIO1I7 TaxID=2607772 RepID=UPI0013CC2331|nr:hypothetical protein [Okeania sp. SIO1I7]NEN92221.1 hypothetical protein [Okeania sp. SIO3H1]NET27433.1 hypothetical protein [Okeania sp. SIO1I7]
MTNLVQLKLYSTVGNLPFHDFQVNTTALGKIVAEKFRQQPELPGVIITKGTKMWGMISQVRFLEYMKLPENKELYSRQPISELLDFLGTPPLVLSENFQINAAVLTALNRPKNYVYEPIIIVLSNGNLRLIDLHDLLLAQSELLVKAYKMIQDRTEKYQSEIPELFSQDEDNDDEVTGLLLESKSLIDQIKNKLKK